MDYGLYHDALTADCSTLYMYPLCLISGLWLFSTLFPEWKCVTKEKEKRSVWLSTPRSPRLYRLRLIHGVYRSERAARLPLFQHQHRFLIISLTNSLCSLTRGCLLLGRDSNRVPRERSQGFTAVALMRRKNKEDQTKKNNHGDTFLRRASSYEFPWVIWQIRCQELSFQILC